MHYYIYMMNIYQEENRMLVFYGNNKIQQQN